MLRTKSRGAHGTIDLVQSGHIDFYKSSYYCESSGNASATGENSRAKGQLAAVASGRARLPVGAACAVGVVRWGAAGMCGQGRGAHSHGCAEAGTAAAGGCGQGTPGAGSGDDCRR